MVLAAWVSPGSARSPVSQSFANSKKTTGRAEYARVPFADVRPLNVPDTLTDEQVLFLSDIFPTGYMTAENCQIKPGNTVAVWGCGPVGQFAVKSAYLQ